jgi:hypothetical protein
VRLAEAVAATAAVQAARDAALSQWATGVTCSPHSMKPTSTSRASTQRGSNKRSALSIFGAAFLAALALNNCYAPDLESCVMACDAGACPDGQHCSNGFCTSEAVECPLRGDGSGGSGGDGSGGGFGGQAPCAGGAFDEDDGPGTSCRDWTTCTSGQYVSSVGTTSANRACAPCPADSFSDGDNAPACTPWTACTDGTVELSAPSSKSDRVCVRPEWVRQFGAGESWFLYGWALSTDAASNVYVICNVNGGGADMVPQRMLLKKYDKTGTFAWQSQFGAPAGSPTRDTPLGVATGLDGSVYVVGRTEQLTHLAEGTVDAFVRKYDAAGGELWTRQFDIWGWDEAFSVAVDSQGLVYVLGRTQTEPPALAQTAAFLRKYDPSGDEAETHMIELGSDYSVPTMAIDSEDNVIFAGHVSTALPGQTAFGNQDGFVAKYDGEGHELWTHQLGTAEHDSVTSITIAEDDSIVIAGTTSGTLPGQPANAGFSDAFVMKLDGGGKDLWTWQWGTVGPDVAQAVSAHRTTGDIYVATFSTTYGPPDDAVGEKDTSVRHLDPDGHLVMSRRIGSNTDRAYGIDATHAGSVFLTGSTMGLPGQEQANQDQAYVMRINPP